MGGLLFSCGKEKDKYKSKNEDRQMPILLKNWFV